jgi:hypothetical protein
MDVLALDPSPVASCVVLQRAPTSRPSALPLPPIVVVRVPRVWDSPERRAAEADRAANSAGWREPSKRRLTTGRRVFARSRRGSGTPRRLPARSPPSPGSTTKRRRMMMAARKPHTDAPASACGSGCNLADLASLGPVVYSHSSLPYASSCGGLEGAPPVSDSVN